jgi:hypothetical protein
MRRFQTWLRFFAWACVLLTLAVVAFCALFVYLRVYDGGDGTCPDLPLAQVRAFVSHYAHRNFSPAVLDFIEPPSYVADLAQWHVPYQLNGHRYIAKLGCSGWMRDHVGPYD